MYFPGMFSDIINGINMPFMVWELSESPGPLGNHIDLYISDENSHIYNSYRYCYCSVS